MMCKVVFAALAVLCASQVMGGRVQLVKGKGLIEDIILARAAIDDMIEASNALNAQIGKSFRIVSVDMADRVRAVIAQLGPLGADQETLDKLTSHIDASLTTVTDKTFALLDILGHIQELILKMRDDLQNNPFALIIDIIDLLASIERMDAATADLIDFTIAETLNVHTELNALLASIEGPGVAEVQAEVDDITAGVLAEYAAVVAANDASTAATAAAVAAIEKVIAGLVPQRA